MLIAAANVDEAVALATRLKHQGTHEWFRGQVRNWTLMSSFVRTPHAAADEAKTRFKLFLRWLRNTPGLEALAASPDRALAVAQHYGLATNFIDFTTSPEVAGYFATEGIAGRKPIALDLEAEESRFFSSEPATNDIGCILCMNRVHVMRVWSLIADTGVIDAANPPEFLEFKVPNLWRLEAQHGVFFYCPFERFEEVVYDMDRIVFPHTGQVKNPTRDLIYPERKSHLELLLDQFFQTEQLRRANQLMREKCEAEGWTTMAVNWGRSDIVDDRYFVSGLLPNHASWDPDQLKGYLEPKPEAFWSALSPLICELSLTGAKPLEIASGVIEELSAFFDRHPDCRNRLVTWSIASVRPWSAQFQAAATDIFDSTRVLPIANGEIARSVGHLAGLFATREFHRSRGNDDALAVCTAFFRESAFQVEVRTHMGSYMRGWVTQPALRSAVRDDLAAHLTELGRERYTDLEYLLFDVPKPEQLFAFDRFCSVLLRQILPTRAIWRSDLPLVASAARVSRFGLP